MACRYREEVVGKRFVCVSAGDRDKCNSQRSVRTWPWKAGVIQAASHRESNHPDLQVLVEFDSEGWQQRRWVSVYTPPAHAAFFVEHSLVWIAPEEDGETTSQPALKFTCLVNQLGVWIEENRVGCVQISEPGIEARHGAQAGEKQSVNTGNRPHCHQPETNENKKCTLDCGNELTLAQSAVNVLQDHTCPLELLVDRKLAFVEYSQLVPFQEWEQLGLTLGSTPSPLSSPQATPPPVSTTSTPSPPTLLQTNTARTPSPIALEAVRTWASRQAGQSILVSTPSVVVGYRAQVYRAEGTTQWYTAVIKGVDQASGELTLTDDTVLEEHSEDPCLLHITLLGDGVVESILRGERVGITPRRSRNSQQNTNNRSVLQPWASSVASTRDSRTRHTRKSTATNNTNNHSISSQSGRTTTLSKAKRASKVELDKEVSVSTRSSRRPAPLLERQPRQQSSVPRLPLPRKLSKLKAVAAAAAVQAASANSGALAKKKTKSKNSVHPAVDRKSNLIPTPAQGPPSLASSSSSSLYSTSSRATTSESSVNSASRVVTVKLSSGVEIIPYPSPSPLSVLAKTLKEVGVSVATTSAPRSKPTDTETPPAQVEQQQTISSKKNNSGSSDTVTSSQTLVQQAPATTTSETGSLPTKSSLTTPIKNSILTNSLVIIPIPRAVIPRHDLFALTTASPSTSTVNSLTVSPSCTSSTLTSSSSVTMERLEENEAMKRPLKSPLSRPNSHSPANAQAGLGNLAMSAGAVQGSVSAERGRERTDPARLWRETTAGQHAAAVQLAAAANHGPLHLPSHPAAYHHPSLTLGLAPPPMGSYPSPSAELFWKNYQQHAPYLLPVSGHEEIVLAERMARERREVEAKERQERDMKERERLERERQQQERERQERDREREREREKERYERERQEREKQVAEQAVVQHFEESLRLAHQKRHPGWVSSLPLTGKNAAALLAQHQQQQQHHLGRPSPISNELPERLHVGNERGNDHHRQQPRLALPKADINFAAYQEHCASSTNSSMPNKAQGNIGPPLNLAGKPSGASMYEQHVPLNKNSVIVGPNADRNSPRSVMLGHLPPSSSLPTSASSAQYQQHLNYKYAYPPNSGPGSNPNPANRSSNTPSPGPPLRQPSYSPSYPPSSGPINSRNKVLSPAPAPVIHPPTNPSRNPSPAPGHLAGSYIRPGGITTGLPVCRPVDVCLPLSAKHNPPPPPPPAHSSRDRERERERERDRDREVRMYPTTAYSPLSHPLPPPQTMLGRGSHVGLGPAPSTGLLAPALPNAVLPQQTQPLDLGTGTREDTPSPLPLVQSTSYHRERDKNLELESRSVLMQEQISSVVNPNCVPGMNVSHVLLDASTHSTSRLAASTALPMPMPMPTPFTTVASTEGIPYGVALARNPDGTTVVSGIITGPNPIPPQLPPSSLKVPVSPPAMCPPSNASNPSSGSNTAPLSLTSNSPSVSNNGESAALTKDAKASLPSAPNVATSSVSNSNNSGGAVAPPSGKPVHKLKTAWLHRHTTGDEALAVPPRLSNSPSNIPGKTTPAASANQAPVISNSSGGTATGDKHRKSPPVSGVHKKTLMNGYGVSPPSSLASEDEAVPGRKRKKAGNSSSTTAPMNVTTSKKEESNNKKGKVRTQSSSEEGESEDSEDNELRSKRGKAVGRGRGRHDTREELPGTGRGGKKGRFGQNPSTPKKNESDASPPPPVNPFNKPSVAQLKKTGESFLQDGACWEVAPRLGKCRECRLTPNQRHKKNEQTANANIFCRFYAFRRLRYTKTGQLAVAGFSDPHREASEDDLKLWLPQSQRPSHDLDVDMSLFLLTHVGDQFCLLAQHEKEARDQGLAPDQNVAWKRVVQGVREMCDVCETTLFNFHWACAKCGFVVCIDCYKTRRSKNENSPGSPSGQYSVNGSNCNSASEGSKISAEDKDKERDPHGWLWCNNRSQHEPEKLMPTQIIAGDALDSMGRLVHEVRYQWNIEQFCDCPEARKYQTQPSSSNDWINGAKLKKEECFTNGGAIKSEDKGDLTNGNLKGNNGLAENSPLDLLADVSMSKVKINNNNGNIKEEAKDAIFNGSDMEDEDDDEEHNSTLRDLLMRPVSKPGSTSGPASAPSTSTDKDKSGIPCKKPKLETLEDVISCVIEQGVDKNHEPNDSQATKVTLKEESEGEKIQELKHFKRKTDVLRTVRTREPLPARIMVISESQALYPDVPHSWLCNGRLLRLLDPRHSGNYRIFQDQWKRGQPVIVSNAGQMLDKTLWLPDTFARDFGDIKNDLVNCLTGNLVPNQPMKKFWDGFERLTKRLKDEKGQPMLLKLKDWPPGEDFAELLPSRFADLMKTLPLAEYTHRNGRLNLAGRLPECFVRPDLGPKMYNAYGAPLEASKGTTNVHLDVSDAANLMVYVGLPKEGNADELIKEALRAIDEAGVDYLTSQRVREAGELPGALWHIYQARDADKIRDLLNKVALERGDRLEPHHDPIHDQSCYLDNALRTRLYKEYGVSSYAIVQCLGDAVFIPAGAPHQVRNLHSCIKVAEDFVSPENVAHCFQLTQEFRALSDSHTNHEDKLQIKNIIFHAIKDSIAVLNNARVARMQEEGFVKVEPKEES